MQQKRPLTRFALCAFAVLCAALAAPALSTASFWLDEAWTVELVTGSWRDLFTSTIADVHPPLYYVVTKLVCAPLGYSHLSFRLAAFLPFVILLVIAVTSFARHLGPWAAFFFILFSALSSRAFYTNAEARMYSWALFFVTLCCWAVFRLLQTNGARRHWVLLVLSGLGAAYTHYYALLMVGFLYLVLLIAGGRSFVRRWAGCVVLSVVGYLPWVGALFTTVGRTMGSFWLTTVPDLDETLCLMFGERFSGRVMLACTALVLAVSLARRTGRGTPAWWLELAAVAVFVGTVAVGYGVSAVVRPVFLSRYLYPAFGAIWLAFGAAVQGLGAGTHTRKAQIILAALGLYACLRPYPATLAELQLRNDEIDSSVRYIMDFAAPDGVVASNAGIALRESVLEFYLPELSVVTFSEDGSWLSADGRSVLCTPELGYLPDDIQATLDAKGLEVVQYRGVRLGAAYYTAYCIAPKGTA